MNCNDCAAALAGFLGRRGAGDHFGARVVQRGADVRHDRALRDAGRGDDLDRVVATGRTEHLGRGLRRERHDLGAGGAVGAAVGRDAGERVRARADLAHHVHLLADREVALR